MSAAFSADVSRRDSHTSPLSWYSHTTFGHRECDQRVALRSMAVLPAGGAGLTLEGPGTPK